MAEELTPMQRQYRAVKQSLPPGSILMFRLGDFYEMFGEDAVIASPILGATLTHRNNMPMCGVPYHALDAYLAKLIRAGKTAALCDQMEDPRTVKSGQIVRREVTRIVTPGTVTEDGLLEENANNWIAAVAGKALALLDLSTGEFTVEEFPDVDRREAARLRYHPAETLEADESNGWTFSPDAAEDTLRRHFNVMALDGFGLADKGDAISAAGALLHYVHVTLHHNVAHIRTLRLRQGDDAMILDAGTLRHLSIIPGDGVTREASLLGVLDVTRTPMGARTLAAWLRQPLRRMVDINARLDAVGAFVNDRIRLGQLQQILCGVRDLQRLIAKVDSGRANARDVKALATSLSPIEDVRRAMADAELPPFLGELVTRLTPEPEMVSLVNRAIAENPNVILSEGNLIRDGYDTRLDELRDMAARGHKWLAEFQTREIERTGIKTLRVKHNSVFGFYIEISKVAAAQAPAEYERRQTLVNAERFTTPELREHERDVSGAQEKAFALEQELFRDVVAKISERTAIIQHTAAALGELDAVLAFADRALAAGYVRPVVDDSDVLSISDGRHPIIEQLPDAEPFVPNSALLDCTENQIILITGPNMAGKSTFIRQVATLAIMAQAGCFVPASAMRLGTLDRVFTRIGAGDDLARGRSTFLVEMQETADILNNATPKSLIVLDEIGRGTSTFDGISIAWSVAEYLHQNPRVKAKTLFATHYHELTDLADRFPGIKNWTVRVREEGGRIAFLRRVVPGIAEKSFGIHVAAMAGMPPAVVTRAKGILGNLEANELDVDAVKLIRKPRRKLSDLPGQMTLF